MCTLSEWSSPLLVIVDAARWVVSTTSSLSDSSSKRASADAPGAYHALADDPRWSACYLWRDGAPIEEVNASGPRISMR